MEDMSVVKSGPPDQSAIGPGAFCSRPIGNNQPKGAKANMDKRELAYAKQTILGVKDWDSYQKALRFYTRLVRSLKPIK